jgi:hypothetical protein
MWTSLDAFFILRNNNPTLLDRSLLNQQDTSVIGHTLTRTPSIIGWEQIRHARPESDWMLRYLTLNRLGLTVLISLP